MERKMADKETTSDSKEANGTLEPLRGWPNLSHGSEVSESLHSSSCDNSLGG